MKPFLNNDFLLQTDFAQSLYHEYAAPQPIIDYHCHLLPEEIAQNKNFETITNIWLDGDHYKWRAMRAKGINEKFISGDASNHDKFMKWAETVPYTVRNPLFHWTHLELQRYFNISDLLTPKNASEIYEECNRLLATPELSVKGIHEKMNVEVVCTTDDPTDSLEHHKKLLDTGYKTGVYPTFRPDNILKIDDADFFNGYLNKLSEASGKDIQSFDQLLDALENRIEYFHSLGCRLSDHGLVHLYADPFNDVSVKNTFTAALEGKEVTVEKANEFRSSVLFHLAKMYHKKEWVQQYHLGAIRNNNDRLQRALGADCGADSIGDYKQAEAMSAFFNRLDNEDTLAKTIVYNLNPAQNEVFATMMGNFNDGSIAGKMQFGSGWWFLDQKDGMEKQINSLSNLGLLSQFIGMLTDSRSFLSYPRHEYFRRVLCNLIGRDVENGELPNDKEWMGEIVSNICYNNAKHFFNFQNQS